MLPVNALIAANLAVLGQGALLLTELDDAAYTRVFKPLFDYGVGSHLRHCLDSYHSFLQGLETGLIDYDQRVRDTDHARLCDQKLANLFKSRDDMMRWIAWLTKPEKPAGQSGKVVLKKPH